jgi:hypothetical protein
VVLDIKSTHYVALVARVLKYKPFVPTQSADLARRLAARLGGGDEAEDKGPRGHSSGPAVPSRSCRTVARLRTIMCRRRRATLFLVLRLRRVAPQCRSSSNAQAGRGAARLVGGGERQRIQDLEGIPPDQQRLVFAGTSYSGSSTNPDMSISNTLIFQYAMLSHYLLFQAFR